MAKIGINLNEVQESRPVPAGRYGLTIATAEVTKSKAGKDQIVASIGIDGHTDSPNINQYISLPNGDDEPSKAQFKALMVKRFLSAFGIPGGADGFDTDDFFGAQADLEVGLSEPNDNGDVYNRIVLPKLKDEGGGAPTGKVATAKPPKR